MIHMIAAASGIAIDAAMGTAAVQIHPVRWRENSFCFYKMHKSFSVLADQAALIVGGIAF